MAVREKVARLLRAVSQASKSCPAHSTALFSQSVDSDKHTENANCDYAFEMNCSNIRYGPGVTQEIGMDLENMGAKKVCVVTDNFIANLPPLSTVMKSLNKQKINFELFKKVRIEPTDESFQLAIDFARSRNFDAFVAVGGGSVIDTCKAANLFSCDSQAQLLDYVSKPIGKGNIITAQLKPMIAVPTTAGTGSETTAVAVFDYTPLKAKTGIAGRALKPTLGLIDPLHALYMPQKVAANSGFDVLCHALESFTALQFFERSPRPDNPASRPVYQGSNPISDVWSLHALRLIKGYFERSVFNNDDIEARSQMHLASTFAGIGFGNAGVHLCHGLSYAISGMVKDHFADGYKCSHPLVPHGLSVVMTAPAVFNFTAPLCPERHLQAAEILGCDITNAKRDDAGPILADALRKIMSNLKVENGLSGLGYNGDDIPALVKGTLPQDRVLKLSPRKLVEEDLTKLFEQSMTVF